MNNFAYRKKYKGQYNPKGNFVYLVRYNEKTLYVGKSDSLYNRLTDHADKICGPKCMEDGEFTELLGLYKNNFSGEIAENVLVINLVMYKDRSFTMFGGTYVHGKKLLKKDLVKDRPLCDCGWPSEVDGKGFSCCMSRAPDDIAEFCKHLGVKVNKGCNFTMTKEEYETSLLADKLMKVDISDEKKHQCMGVTLKGLRCKCMIDNKYKYCIKHKR